MTGPTKMRLPYAAKRLHLVSNPIAEKQHSRETPTEKLYRGVGYEPEYLQAHPAIRGSADILEQIGGFRYTSQSGKIIPLETADRRFLWEATPTENSDNEFRLLNASLESPSLEQGIDSTHLTISPEIQFSFHTHAFGVQIGEIRLVSSERFITDVNGEAHTLMNTQAAEAPVLYYPDPIESPLLYQVTDWQAQGLDRTYDYKYRIHQRLFPKWQGHNVRSITVLEHYSSYFLQRAMTQNRCDSIWVPVYAPIFWGWSVRVEPDDDEWMITRRKLILPTCDENGWQLPQWQGRSCDFDKETFSE